MSNAVMARMLLREAGTILPALPPPHCDEPLAAIDEFVAAPRPWRFLRALRLLRQALRDLRAGEAIGDLQERSFQRGLERLSALTFIGPELAGALKALPRDPRAGVRLQGLAVLLEAHHELAGRIRQIEATKPQSSAQPRRRSGDR